MRHQNRAACKDRPKFGEILDAAALTHPYVPAPPPFFLDPLQCHRHPVAQGDPPQQELAATIGATEVRESEEGKCLRLPGPRRRRSSRLRTRLSK
jgi:hypothetical protein